MLEFSSTESCTTSTTSTPLVGFSSNDSSCDGNVALMNDFESTEGCNGQGPQGPEGFSAYQIAVFDGFVGTETQWLASLVGPGVPVGGTAGQILAKIDLTNYNTQWINNFALPSLTSGSVLFSNGTTLAQNNANFFWNNANNRLGIGTTTPSYALHVNGVTGATTFTIPSYNSQLNQNYLMLYGGYGAGMQGTYNNPTGGDLTFGTFINSIFNEKMRLLPSGNLGIGTTTPTFQLDVNRVGGANLGKWARLGSIIAAGEGAGSYPSIGYNIESNVSGFKYIAGDFASWIKFSQGGLQFNTAVSGTAGTAITAVTSMTILQNGNVGIGITTPIYLLDVAGAINSVSGLSATDVAYRINGSGVLGKTTAGNFPSNTGYTRFIGQGMLFSANNDNTVQMVIMPTTGNVGIGTTTPTSKLDILDTVLAGSAALAGSVLNLAQTWNTTGTPTAIKLNVTDTASNASSLLMDLQVGSVSKFNVRKDGTAVCTGFGNINQTFNFNSSGIVTTSGVQNYAGGLLNSLTRSQTSGNLYGFRDNTSINPTSGNANWSIFEFIGIINQTGGASGVTRGLYVNPTLTAAAAFRAIETTVGNVILGSTSGNVGIGITTPTARLQVKGDGTNPVARFESSAGNNFFTINNSGQAIFGSVGANEPYLVNYNGTSTESGIGQSLRIRQRANTGATGNTLIQYWADGLFNNTTSGTAISHEFLSSGVACAVGNTIYRNTSFAYTINNTGAQTGTATGIFLNATETALNGMVHNLMDLQVGGVSKFRVSKFGELFLGGYFKAEQSSSIGWAGTRSQMYSPSDGVITLNNNASTDFGRLQLGGTTSSFPAIKRNGTSINFVLADDSGFCSTTAAVSYASNSFSTGGYILAGSGAIYQTANTNTRLNIFTTGFAIELNGATAIAPSAILDLKSATQGFLPPRMTTAQKVAIATPATGLVVFDTDLGKLCVFAVTWQTITSV